MENTSDGWEMTWTVATAFTGPKLVPLVLCGFHFVFLFGHLLYGKESLKAFSFYAF